MPKTPSKTAPKATREAPAESNKDEAEENVQKQDNTKDLKGRGSKIVPQFSVSKSKKGVLHIWVQLPRSVPESCLNMDANQTHFHLDTKGWGSNYEVDIPFPSDTTVVLKEGEEAEAEFQGGVLKVRFMTTEAVKSSPSQRPGGKRSRDSAADSDVKKKKQRKELPTANDKVKAPVSKENAQANTSSSAKPKPKAAKAAKPKSPATSEKEGCLKLIDDISNAEETKIESKLTKEKERDEAIARVEEVRKKRKEDKVMRKQTLLSKLKTAKKPAAAAADDEDAAEAPAAAAAAAAKPRQPRKRVSWGSDELREFTK